MITSGPTLETQRQVQAALCSFGIFLTLKFALPVCVIRCPVHGSVVGGEARPSRRFNLMRQGKGSCIFFFFVEKWVTCDVPLRTDISEPHLYVTQHHSGATLINLSFSATQPSQKSPGKIRAVYVPSSWAIISQFIVNYYVPILSTTKGCLSVLLLILRTFLRYSNCLLADSWAKALIHNNATFMASAPAFETTYERPWGYKRVHFKPFTHSVVVV